jgi:hypothetical protein
MRQRSILTLLALSIIASIGLVGCGGSNPMASSTTATIQGSLNASSSTQSLRAQGSDSQSGAQVTVTVEGTTISTVTDSSGNFTLTGLTPGTITLVFQGNGINAKLTISGLQAGETLTISVQATGNHAEQQQASPSPSPSPSGSPSPSPSPSPSATPSPQVACFGVGSNAQVEGNITAVGPSDITVQQGGGGGSDSQGGEGNGGGQVSSVDCLVGSSTVIRHGNTMLPFSSLAIGNHVHVSGMSLGVVNGMCEVQASEIKVQ